MMTGRRLVSRAFFRLLLVAQIIAVVLSGIAAAEQPPAPVTAPGRSEAEDMHPRFDWRLNGSHGVDGRQGVAWEEGGCCISGSTTLSRYDGD